MSDFTLLEIRTLLMSFSEMSRSRARCLACEVICSAKLVMLSKDSLCQVPIVGDHRSINIQTRCNAIRHAHIWCGVSIYKLRVNKKSV